MLLTPGPPIAVTLVNSIAPFTPAPAIDRNWLSETRHLSLAETVMTPEPATVPPMAKPVSMPTPSAPLGIGVPGATPGAYAVASGRLTPDTAGAGVVKA